MPPRPTHQARASCRPGTGTIHSFGCCGRVVSASTSLHEIWFNVNTRTRGAEDPYGTVRGRLNGV